MCMNNCGYWFTMLRLFFCFWDERGKGFGSESGIMDESQDCGSNVIIVCLFGLLVLIWLFSTNYIVLVWSG